MHYPADKTIQNGDTSRVVVDGHLSKGSYLVIAKFVLRNKGAGDERPNCQLGIRRGIENLFDPIDKADVYLGTADPGRETVITLVGAAYVEEDDTPVEVQCEPFGSPFKLEFREREMIATQVATITDVS